jgi:surface antigen
MSQMSITDVLSRISQLETLTPATIGSPTLQSALAASPAGSSSFASVLAGASTNTTSATATNGIPTSVGLGTAGSSILTAAESQIGQSEQPPGSNDGPAIATYRTAVAGAQAGEPWCAYFVSWAAQQAGTPIGSDGQGLGSVAGITDWAQQNGRLLPASATPQAGDLILFGTRHVGIVKSVNPDGTLTTVEGNHGNAVQQVTRNPSEATGYVAMS